MGFIVLKKFFVLILVFVVKVKLGLGGVKFFVLLFIVGIIFIFFGVIFCFGLGIVFELFLFIRGLVLGGLFGGGRL